MAFPDKPIAQLTGSNGPIHAVSYSASPGTYILTGSGDRSIRLYNPGTPSAAAAVVPSHLGRKAPQDNKPAAIPQGRLVQTYAAHGYEVLSLAVASDNARFASAGGDRAVFLWDVATAQTLRRLGPHGSGRVHAVAFAGEGDSLVVSGGFDARVRLWDTRAGGGGARPVQELADARDAVSCLAVAGAQVLAGSVDGRVRCYDVRAGRCVTDVVGAAGVTSLCLTRDARALLVGCLDSRLRLMDREKGTCLRTYGAGAGTGAEGMAEGQWRNEELRVQSVLGGREKFVVAGDEMTGSGSGGGGGGAPGEGRVWAWDLLTGKLVAKLRVPWGPGDEQARKKVIGRDGKEKERKNVVSCVAWKEGGWGDQFCVGGTSGVVTVFGPS